MKTPSRKREENKKQNRQMIIDAAILVFCRLGYEACTVRDIVADTPLATGTFYNYFESKEELFREIIDQKARITFERVELIRKKAENINDFVELTYLALFQEIAEDPLGYELSKRNEQIIATLYDLPAFSIGPAILLEDIKNAIKRGILPPVDADYLCAAFMGVGAELARAMKEKDKDALEPAKAAEFAAALFLGGINNLPNS